MLSTFDFSAVVSGKKTHIKLKDQQLPVRHAGTPKLLNVFMEQLLNGPPTDGFQHYIGGPRVTSSSPFFSSFHVPLFLPLSNFYTVLLSILSALKAR